MNDIDIRYSEMEDIEPLRKWLQDPECLKWFPIYTPQEVEDYTKNWIGFSRFRASLTASLEGKPCGVATLFLMPYRKVAHHAMFVLLVDPGQKGKGVGTSLVKNILNLGKNYFCLESLHIEVYEGSPIIPILQHFQFVCYATQNRYVKWEKEYLTRTLWQSPK